MPSSLCVFHFAFFCAFVSLCLCLCLCLCLRPSLSLSLCVFICVFVSVCLRPFLRLSASSSVSSSLCLPLSVSAFVSSSVCVFVCFFVSLSLPLFLCLPLCLCPSVSLQVCTLQVNHLEAHLLTARMPQPADSTYSQPQVLTNCNELCLGFYRATDNALCVGLTTRRSSCVNMLKINMCCDKHDICCCEK